MIVTRIRSGRMKMMQGDVYGRVFFKERGAGRGGNVRLDAIDGDVLCIECADGDLGDVAPRRNFLI